MAIAPVPSPLPPPDRDLLVIVPTYNEADNIAALIDAIVALPMGADVLVVDDGSPDGTAAIARAAGIGTMGRVHVLERAGKMGLGTAYIAGFREAIARGYRFAATMDADWSHSPGHLVEMRHMAALADVVIGSRYIAGGGIRNWGWHRHVLSWFANTMARRVAGLCARDCTSGYRLYRVGLLRRLPLDRMKSDGYSSLLELLAWAQRAGARVREVPIIFHDRRAGQSKISHREITKALWTLRRVRRLLAKR